HLAMLLVTLCGFVTANAQLESDDISEAILVEGSVPVRWTNDATHPWYIDSDENGSYMRTPESEEDHQFKSTLTFTYSSAYPTEITLEWKRYYNGADDMMSLVVDGETKQTLRRGYWTANNGGCYVPAGNHTVQIVSNYNHNYYYDECWGGVRNLRVRECKELESTCLKEGSLPLTFENDTDLDKMWITDDGYVRSPWTTSTKTSTTFTIENRPALFSYEIRKCRDSSYGYFNVYVDGNIYQTVNNYETSWYSGNVVLYPGTHTIEFVGGVTREDYTNSIQLRNVCLHQNWYEAILNDPGKLGTQLTQIMGGRPIQEMELLKIKGAMNADDWDKLKLATGIKAIDFTETGITSVPANGCSGLSYLSTVMLPETVKEIGNEAFRSTNFYQVTIPASVESIGNSVWSGTPLMYISFAENSQLKTIGHSAFKQTRIMEFDMPDSVEELVTAHIYSSQPYISCLFENCTSLMKLHLSEGLDCVPGFLADDCTSLSEVNIPFNATNIDVNAFYNTNISAIEIPEAVTWIGNSAFARTSLESVTIPKDVASLGSSVFANCENLKNVHLNSHCWDMSETFYRCTALEKVVMPCATPPTTRSNYDPFYDVTKSSVTLVVPDFAFDTYRSDSYWYGFTNTVKGDEASINDYWAIRGTLNLNNTLAMQGKPSVEIMTGGKLTLDANSAQTFKEFTYNTSESTPAVVLSQSNTVKADRLVSKFNVASANRWYFFSPVTDVNMSEVTYPASDSWVIRYYDGARRASEDAASGNWVNVPADGTLKGGQGYIIQAREAGWLYLPAASATENDKFFGANAVTFDLADNACETEANAGWNFVANPYPTYYDIYYIDMQAPITVWDGSTYRAYSLNDGDRGDDTFVLRPMQPFFVQKSEAGLSTGMPLVGRQINTTIDRSRAPRPVVVDENRHKLNLELFC
ncbi:MAG: leucine-rich repeat domain-containing protein, partial [Muribaculaceae bacterium]|nr:leucine-rich repeat domain-containing protein [Muribaculaceae bacterium]